jgi:hypothetical protein
MEAKPNIELEKFQLEVRKFELEKEKFNYTKTIDKQKLKSDRLTKFWTQFSILTPLLILIVGFFLNSYSERTKREHTQQEGVTNSKRSYIEKQLSQFYYPIQLRLNKDNAFFTTSRNEKVDETLRKKIEDDFMIPNHEEILRIIDDHFDLIKNESEDDSQVKPLINAIKAYERHVAIYKVLKGTGDLRKPIQVGEKFPKEFFTLIDRRIADLENQRDKLLLQ